MKQHPILYSTAMVQAKLSGRKTQTRRMITSSNCVTTIQKKYLDWRHHNIFINGNLGIKLEHKQYGTLWRASCKWQPGDLMWVRETWGWGPTGKGQKLVYKADYNGPVGNFRWHPSIHMFKVQARIWDEGLTVRAERLQDITEEDAIAEGIEFEEFTWGPIAFPDGTIDHCVDGKKSRSFRDYSRQGHFLVDDPIGCYRSLWESINGKGSWDLNPLVWRVETKPFSKDNE